MRGAVAGALAAAAWQACDPVLERAFGTPYSDAQLLGPFITRGRYEWRAFFGVLLGAAVRDV